MRIKMNNLSMGPSGKMEKGGIYEVDETKGRELVSKGYAEEVAAPVRKKEKEKPSTTTTAKKKTAKK